MSAYQEDLERGFRMTTVYDHACERKPLAMAAARAAGVKAVVEFSNRAWLAGEADLEARLDAGERQRRAEAMQRHPAGRAKVRECTPAAWSPAPDPIHWAPRMSNWDIVRDLVALAWKVIRR